MRILLAFIIATSFLAGMRTGANSQSEKQVVNGAVVLVDGLERSVDVGTIVVNGELIDSKAGKECKIPEIRYGIFGSGDGTAAITLDITDTCAVVVSSIELDVQVPVELMGFVTVRRQTGGWHHHKDCCGLVLTETYAHIKYYDTGSTVYGAYGHYTFCQNALDGWYGTGSIWNWANPSSYV